MHQATTMTKTKLEDKPLVSFEMSHFILKNAFLKALVHQSKE